MALPLASDDDFPAALKNARLAKGYSYAKLAELVGIHPNMPSRYENLSHGSFTRPSFDTWQKISAVLADQVDLDTPGVLVLANASIEEIIAELKKRGASSVSVQW